MQKLATVKNAGKNKNGLKHTHTHTRTTHKRIMYNRKLMTLHMDYKNTYVHTQPNHTHISHIHIYILKHTHTHFRCKKVNLHTTFFTKIFKGFTLKKRTRIIFYVVFLQILLICFRRFLNSIYR